MLVVDGEMIGEAELFGLVEEEPSRLSRSVAEEDLVPEVVLPCDVLLSHVAVEPLLERIRLSFAEFEPADRPVIVVDEVEGLFSFHSRPSDKDSVWPQSCGAEEDALSVVPVLLEVLTVKLGVPLAFVGQASDDTGIDFTPPTEVSVDIEGPFPDDPVVVLEPVPVNEGLEELLEISE